MKGIARFITIIALSFLGAAAADGTSLNPPVGTYAIDNGGDGSGTTSCPDKIYTEVRDVNVLSRYSCTLVVGATGAIITTASCAASAGWGCGLAGAATAGALLACSEIYASQKQTFQVRETYMYVSKVYFKGCWFVSRSYIRLD